MQEVFSASQANECGSMGSTYSPSVRTKSPGRSAHRKSNGSNLGNLHRYSPQNDSPSISRLWAIETSDLGPSVGFPVVRIPLNLRYSPWAWLQYLKSVWHANA